MSDSEATKNVATTFKENDSLAVRALPATVVFGLLAMALAVSGHVTIVDLDLYHEMAIFREMLQIGYLPLTDSFAYTPTNRLIVHHEWGTGAAFYLLTVSAGLEPLVWWEQSTCFPLRSLSVAMSMLGGAELGRRFLPFSRRLHLGLDR